MDSYRLIPAEALSDNPFTLIGKDWMLITATDDKGDYNTMTASWGGVGVLWNKNVCFLFVRPERYTHDFAEKGSCMTLTFFGEEHRDALRFCGRNSGRTIDKVKACGLTPVRDEDGAVYFEEGRLVISVRKLYCGKLEESAFIDRDLLSHYESGGYHTFYIAEISSVRIKNTEEK